VTSVRDGVTCYGGRKRLDEPNYRGGSPLRENHARAFGLTMPSEATPAVSCHPSLGLAAHAPAPPLRRSRR
jgi:hypothetical protein